MTGLCNIRCGGNRRTMTVNQLDKTSPPRRLWYNAVGTLPKPGPPCFCHCVGYTTKSSETSNPRYEAKPSMNHASPARLSLKTRLDALAVGLHNAAQRDLERQQLSQLGTMDADSPSVGVGVFELSGTMQERHKKMDEMQQAANARISEDTTRF